MDLSHGHDLSRTFAASPLRLNEQRQRVSLLASLNMLIMTAGGFDFTAADCIDWMRETGFRDMRVEPLTGEVSMVVGIK